MKNASILKGLGNKKKLLPSKIIYVYISTSWRPACDLVHSRKNLNDLLFAFKKNAVN